jgi:hypothetical protein
MNSEAITGVQRHIRRMRACRVLVVLAAALNAFMLAVDIAAGSLSALLALVAVIGCLLLLVKQTRVIGTMRRRERELSRPRMTAEDYRRLRELEIELGWEPSAPPESLAPGGVVALEPREPPACECGKSAEEHAREWDEQVREQVIASQGIPPSRVATAAELHFAQLARVGRERCTGFCPICQDFDRNAREAAAGAVQGEPSAPAARSAPMTGPGGRWRPLSELPGRDARVAEHDAMLAAEGRESCIFPSYCPVCAKRAAGPEIMRKLTEWGEQQ